MLKFKHNVTGNIVEVTEEIAEQLLRPQNKYTEVKYEPVVIEVDKPKVSKKKTKKS